jgi:uncharacterized repeat protein (TIGR01451 family)
MRRLPDPASWFAAFFFGLLGLSCCAGLAAQGPPCIGGTQQSFSATGSIQTYFVPADVTAVYLIAEGASGGDASQGVGGYGAHIAAQLPVSGPATLNVLVGVQGAAPGSSGAGAGGGGGSFVYSSGNSLLLAAGGGGGAHQNNGGSSAQIFENGGDGDRLHGGAGGVNGGGGGGGGQLGSGNGGGGGGGILGAGSSGLGALPGQGGHQVSTPGDAAGGAGAAPDGGAGGFGGGGGGGASPLGGGGGGGGYSGGGGGGGKGGDYNGGGGSFVAAGATFVDREFLSAAGPGSVTICASQTAVPDLTIAKSHAGSFRQGDTGQQYAITVSNLGSAATSMPVTVTDILPFGLVATAFGGSGWVGCTATPVTGPGTLACSRSDALAPGNLYPSLTLTVDVNSDAPALVTNSAQVAGGGETNTANDTAEDPTTIEPGVTPACSADSNTLCLNGQRFRVTASFDAGGGNAGAAHAITLTEDTGYFWFFSAANVEVVVKVLNGCVLNQHYWIFAGGLTNVHGVLTVKDTLTGVVKTYSNPADTAFAPVQDTAALATCP